MPIVVVDDEGERKPLKTAPPDGYVILRGLTHGQKMARQQLNNKMVMKTRRGQKDIDTVLELFNEQTTLFDFAHCIIGHNLMDKDGREFNFKDPLDVKRLPGKVAEEISKLMDELNNFEDDEELGKS